MRTFWFSLALAPWFGLALAANGKVVHDDDAGPLYGHRGFRASSDVYAAAFAPDGSFLLTLAGGQIQKWSMPDGAALGEIAVPCSDPDYTGEALAISPDGKRFAVSCDYDSVRIVELATGANVLSIAGDAHAVSWSGDGATLGVIGGDGARLIDAKTGRVRKRWAGEYDLHMVSHGATWAVVGPELHAAGEQADTGGWGDPWGVQVTDSEGKKRWSAPVNAYGSPVTFSVDGKHVVVVSNAAVKKLDAATGRQLVKRQFDDSVYALTPRKGGYFAQVGERLLRLDDQLEVEGFDKVPVEGLVATRDGAFVAGLGVARVPVFAHDGKKLHSDQGLPSTASHVATSADGNVVVAMSADGSAVVIDRKKGSVKPLELGSWPDLLDVSRDGSRAAVYTGSRVVLVDLATGGKTPVRGTDDDSVVFLAFAPDGQTLHVILGWDDLELATVKTAKAQITTKRVLGPGDAYGAVLSDDGSVLLVPMHDGQVRAVSLK